MGTLKPKGRAKARRPRALKRTDLTMTAFVEGKTPGSLQKFVVAGLFEIEGVESVRTLGTLPISDFNIRIVFGTARAAYRVIHRVQRWLNRFSDVRLTSSSWSLTDIHG